MINFNEKLRNFINEESVDTGFLEPKDSLHPKFWSDMRFKGYVSRKLKRIARDILKNLQIEDIIDDIILTGSIASFNWHEMSDIDLHFIFDFAKIDKNEELVKKMLDLTRMKWNKDHKIEIFGHEVEIYFQNLGEEHESMGVYSVIGGNWIQNPEMTSKKPNIAIIQKKFDAISREIDRIYDLFTEKQYSQAHKYAKTLKRKIKYMRSAGLSEEGVYSVENLTFKALRNQGKLGRLSSLKNTSYDRLMSSNGLITIKRV